MQSSNLTDMYRKASTSESADNSESEEEEMDMMKVLKDIEYLGRSFYAHFSQFSPKNFIVFYLRTDMLLC